MLVLEEVDDAESYSNSVGCKTKRLDKKQAKLQSLT